LEEERAGVLAWFLTRASVAIKQNHFTHSSTTAAITGNWRVSSDRVALFVEQRCKDTGEWTLIKLIHKEFVEWCIDSGFSKLNISNLGKRLVRLKIPKRRGKEGWSYRLEIKSETIF
jgi:phage/plasmid-associated DNA primase